MNIEAQVRRLLGETVGPYDWENVPADEDLRRDGMNSLNCISLVVAIEEAFGIEVPPVEAGAPVCRHHRGHLRPDPEYPAGNTSAGIGGNLSKFPLFSVKLYHIILWKTRGIRPNIFH